MDWTKRTKNFTDQHLFAIKIKIFCILTTFDGLMSDELISQVLLTLLSTPLDRSRTLERFGCARQWTNLIDEPNV